MLTLFETIGIIVIGAVFPFALIWLALFLAGKIGELIDG